MAKNWSKELIRKEILKKRMDMDSSLVKEKGERIVSKILWLEEYVMADAIYLYYPIRNEADVVSLIDDGFSRGKRVLLPKVINQEQMEFYEIYSHNDLEKGYMGIYEPKINNHSYREEKAEKSFMVVPAVAFDEKCGRMGMGAGFYDRYLDNHLITTTCMVCYDFQRVEQIPMEPHDKTMDYVVTETSVFRNFSN